ncbi:MAG: hypothetical protein JOZ23_20390 [Mycobacterium sp.]|nr:hypothetical protein [Mycobacterium sp.]
MYARSTTIQAQPARIDAGIAHIRDEVMPALQQMNGCIGLSLLVDRESRRCIATSSWECERAMHASGEQVLPLQQRAAEVFGGSPAVDRWEIAVLHRDHRSHDGAYVRATWVRVGPDQIDKSIEFYTDFYKSSVLADLENLDGFCSASLMVDRASRRAVSCATFDSIAAMDRNREQATALQTARTREVGAHELDECEFELAIAHLRVPELV